MKEQLSAKRKTENQSNGLPYVIDFNEYDGQKNMKEFIYITTPKTE